MFIDTDSLVVGEPLPQDLFRNGVLLVAHGTLVTEALRATLRKYNAASLDAAVADVEIPKMDSKFLDRKIYLDLDTLIAQSQKLVEGLLAGSVSGVMHLVYDYDESTYTHSKNVAVLASMVGVHEHLNVDSLYNLCLGALLHDIGKLGVAKSILCKPARLTDAEFSVMKQHPVVGYDTISANSVLPAAVKQIVLQHHENWDGSGYPRGLLEYNSYRLARIVHICDVYEAMCAKRPYKDPMPRRDVREYLLSKRGEMFEPKLVTLFLEAVPPYLPGESIQTRYGDECIVITSDGGLDPLVRYNGEVCNLAQIVKQSA